MNYTYLIFLFILNFLPTFTSDNSDFLEEGYREVTIFASKEGGIPIPDSVSGITVQIKAAFLLKTIPPTIEYLERETPATIRLQPDFSYGFISKNDARGVLTAFVQGEDKQSDRFGMQADAIFINNSGKDLKDMTIHGHNALFSPDSILSEETSALNRAIPKEIEILGSDGQLSGWTDEPKLGIPFQAAFFYKTQPPSILFMEGKTPCELKIEQDFHYAFFCTSSDSLYLMVCMDDLPQNEKKPRTCSEGKQVFIYNSNNKRYMSSTSY